MPSREEHLEAAIETVSGAGLDPESAGGAAALAFLLDRLGTGSGTRPTARQSGGDLDPEEDSPGDRLAEWIGTEPERAEDVVELTDAGARLMIPVDRLRRGKADRQRVLTLLKVATDRVAYGTEDVPARQVNAICDDYSCLDQNLANNVASSGLVTRRGRRGAYVYRVTQPGLDRARVLLSELLEGDAELSV